MSTSSDTTYTVRFRTEQGERQETQVLAESVTEAIEQARHKFYGLYLHPGRIDAVIREDS